MNRSTLRLLCSFLVLDVCAFAQRDLGTITGTITDPQGGVLPSVKVTIVETATGVKYETATGATGVFVRPTLPVGTYSVTVEASGFRRTTRVGVVLTGGERVGVDLQLQIGDVSQTVEVSATAAPLLQSESVIVGAALEHRMFAELPLGSQRTFTFLAQLTPGVLPAESGARDANGGGFAANGVSSSLHGLPGYPPELGRRRHLGPGIGRLPHHSDGVREEGRFFRVSYHGGGSRHSGGQRPDFRPTLAKRQYLRDFDPHRIPGKYYSAVPDRSGRL